MRKKEKMFEICDKVLRELYANAEPSVDWDVLRKSEEIKQPRWYWRYYLSEQKEKEIVDKICKKHKITAFERRSINWTVMDYGPTNNRDRWVEMRT